MWRRTGNQDIPPAGGDSGDFSGAMVLTIVRGSYTLLYFFRSRMNPVTKATNISPLKTRDETKAEVEEPEEPEELMV